MRTEYLVVMAVGVLIIVLENKMYIQYNVCCI